jgi:AcrR family transcriptional regulator
VKSARPANAEASEAESVGVRRGDTRSADTRRKLLDGAIETLRARGIAGTSARAIAAASGVNQALIFYHFGSVEELVDVACRQATAERVGLYRQRFAAVGSLRGLLHIGREIREMERGAGNVIALAQVLAGAQQDERLALTARDCLAMWVAEIESALTRLTADTPIADVADPAGLAQGVAAAFIGIVLYERVNPVGASAALDTLEQLAVMSEVIDDLGPVARRALRSRMRRTARSAQPGAVIHDHEDKRAAGETEFT